MKTATHTTPFANGTPEPNTGDTPPGRVLGRVESDTPASTNEHVVVRVPGSGRPDARRGQFVRIDDALHGTRFLGRVVAGPFFPDGADGDVRVRVELHGELTGERANDTNDRPAPGSPVYALTADEVGDLLGCSGDMLLGTLAGCDDLRVGLDPDSKDVLPRNAAVTPPATIGSRPGEGFGPRRQSVPFRPSPGRRRRSRSAAAAPAQTARTSDGSGTGANCMLKYNALPALCSEKT